MSTTQQEIEHRPAARALAIIRAEHWAITEAGLDQIEAIAARENVITPEVLAKIEARKAVAAKKATRMDGTDGVERREGGVAILGVDGPIFPYANLFTQISGATSIETLALDFNTAVNDSSTRSIIMRFDSPGGNVALINEFANQIYTARGSKPIIAYVPVMACSAAYWLASACDEIVIDALAEVGSIGVLARGGKKQQSASMVEVKSKRASRKNLDPETEAGKAVLQGMADATEGVMVASIARNREMSEEDVTKAEGSVLMGQAAIDAGLADRIGSLEGLISELGGASADARLGQFRNASKETTMTKQLTAEERLAELEARFAGQTTELEAARKLNATALESQVTAEVTAFMAPLRLAGEGGDLRFNVKELTAIEGMLQAAKMASVGVGAMTDIKAIGAFFVTGITAYVAAKSPSAPAGELPKPAETQGNGVAPVLAVFDAAKMGDRDAVAKVTAYINTLCAADPKKTAAQHLNEAHVAARLAAKK